MLVLIINFSAKIILAYATANMQGNQDTILSSLFEPLSDPFHRKKPKKIPSCSDVETVSVASKELFSKPEEILTSEPPNESAQNKAYRVLLNIWQIPRSITLKSPWCPPARKNISVGAGIKRGFNTISQKGTRIFVHDTVKRKLLQKWPRFNWQSRLPPLSLHL